MRRHLRALIGFTAVLALVVVAVPAGAANEAKKSKKLEGEVSILHWAGYAEDGTTPDYETVDWVTPFEEETGCEATTKVFNTSDEAFNLFATVSTTRCPHRATLRCAAS